MHVIVIQLEALWQFLEELYCYYFVIPLEGGKTVNSKFSKQLMGESMGGNMEGGMLKNNDCKDYDELLYFLLLLIAVSLLE